MPPRLVFLGWERPVLPAAAAHLVDHYLRGGTADMRRAVLVLPGRRACRRLVELLAEEAAARNAVLIPPPVVTMERVPELLYAPDLPAADELATRRAWSMALRGMDPGSLHAVFPHLGERTSLAEWDSLAAALAELHRTLAGEGHRFADVVRVCRSGALFDDSPRWEVLAEVQRRYLALLAEAGLADPFEARLAALARGIPHREGEIWLVSVAELHTVTRNLLEASGAELCALVHAPPEMASSEPAPFDSWGLPVAEFWEGADVPVTGDVLRMVDRPVDQADAVVEALEELEGAYTTEEVVVGVHPQAEVVPYLQERLAARGVGARYAAGTPLARTGPVRILQAVADYLDGRTYPALAALLRHPDARALLEAGGMQTGASQAIEGADAYFARHLPHVLAGPLPREWGREREPGEDFPALVRALDSESALGSFRGRRPLSRWMPEVARLLEQIYGRAELDRSRPDERRLVDVLAEIRAAVLSLHQLPASLDEVCTGAEALRAVMAGVEGNALPPDPSPAAVELLEWLEIPLDDAPVLVLTGFNEGFVPDSVHGHPFLPDSLRALLGVTHNRLRLARDAYRLTCVLHSRARVRLIAGRRTAQGDPLRPSRLMFRTGRAELASRVLDFLGGREAEPRAPDLAALGLGPAARSAFGVPPEPVLELAPEEIPTSLPVTAFAALLADPYRFVLEHVLGLERVDDDAQEMDALGFGDLAHRALQGFGRMAMADPPQVDPCDARAVAETLVRLLRREVSERFGPSALPAVHLQAAQLEERLKAFAVRQAEWAAQGWRIAAVECKPAGDGWPLDVDGTPILLRARIDRMDHNPSTGAWAVLDYKTGKPETPEEAHGHRKGDGATWTGLQLPLYRHMLASVVGPDGERIVPPEEAAKGPVVLGYVTIPEDPAQGAFLLAEWSEEDLATALEAARNAVRLLRQGRFTFDPRQTRPGGEGEDALRPLLLVGWQAPGRAGDDEGDAGADPGGGGERTLSAEDGA